MPLFVLKGLYSNSLRIATVKKGSPLFLGRSWGDSEPSCRGTMNGVDPVRLGRSFESHLRIKIWADPKGTAHILGIDSEMEESAPRGAF